MTHKRSSSALPGSVSEPVADTWMERERHRREFVVERQLHHAHPESDLMKDTRLRLFWILPGRDGLYQLDEESSIGDADIIEAFLNYDFPNSDARYIALKNFLVLASRINGVLSGARIFAIIDKFVDRMSHWVVMEEAEDEAPDAEVVTETFNQMLELCLKFWQDDFGEQIFAEILEQRELAHPGYVTPAFRVLEKIEDEEGEEEEGDGDEDEGWEGDGYDDYMDYEDDY